MPCNEPWGTCSLPCCKSRFSQPLVVLSALPSLPLLLNTSSPLCLPWRACQAQVGTGKPSHLYIDNIINVGCSAPSTPPFPSHGSSITCPSPFHPLPSKVKGRSRRLGTSPAELHSPGPFFIQALTLCARCAQLGPVSLEPTEQHLASCEYSLTT